MVRFLEGFLQHFKLQNIFYRILAVTLTVDRGVRSFGQFHPRQGPAHVNSLVEPVWHFTRTGAVPLERLAIGVPHTDRRNDERTGEALRCRGNAWFVPPSDEVELARWVLRLTGKVRNDALVLNPSLDPSALMLRALVTEPEGPAFAGFSPDEALLERLHGLIPPERRLPSGDEPELIDA